MNQLRDPFNGMADFEIHPLAVELQATQAKSRAYCDLAFRYEIAMHRAANVLLLPKGTKVGEIRRRIDLALGELACAEEIVIDSK